MFKIIQLSNCITKNEWLARITKSIRDGTYEFSIEGCYKEISNLIKYKDGARFLGTTTNWVNLVEANSDGKHMCEIFVVKKQGETIGWIGYT